MNKLLSSLVAMAACVALSTTARAAVLLPGDVVNTGAGDTFVTAPNTGGVVQNDNLIPFSFPVSSPGLVGGDVQNRVVLSTGLNTMVFKPRIRNVFNTATIGFEITGFRLDGYAGWDTDVGYLTDGLGQKGPTSITRSADGDLLTFRYDVPLFISGLVGGQRDESLFPYITTNAPNYSLTGGMTIFGRDTANPDNLLSVTIDGLAVPSPIPIPAAAWLFGTALIGFIGYSRRRKIG